MFIRLLIISLLVITSNKSYSACLGTKPIAAAKVFYKKHEDFHYANPAKNHGILSTRLKDALAMEYQCKVGVCALDFDPWIDAQDGDISNPKLFKQISKSDNKAEVLMSYQFVIDQSRIQQKSVKIMLEHTKNASCWVVSDLITPSGQSVLTILERWQSMHSSSYNHSSGTR